ncbi:hypothetical protein RKD41_004834 [Streptomyces tendae]
MPLPPGGPRNHAGPDGLSLGKVPGAEQPTAAPAPAPAPQPGGTPVEQLRQLAELRDVGILSEEEFTSKKAEILARM